MKRLCLTISLCGRGAASRASSRDYVRFPLAAIHTFVYRVFVSLLGVVCGHEPQELFVVDVLGVMWARATCFSSWYLMGVDGPKEYGRNRFCVCTTHVFRRCTWCCRRAIRVRRGE